MIPLIIIRIVDKAILTLNDDGETYSFVRMKIDYPQSYRHKYQLKHLPESLFNHYYMVKGKVNVST